MTARTLAATAFVQLWQFLSATIGPALALLDHALQADRRDYLEACVCA